MTELREVWAVVLDSGGQTLGNLRIADRYGATIQQLDARVAADHNEETIQLLEGRTYDYRIEDLMPGVAIVPSGSVQPNQLAPNSGRIETGSWTGALVVEVADSQGVVGSARLEVRSAKLTYRAEYRTMLDDIAQVAAALLLQVRSPAAGRMSPDPERDVETLHQRLAVLRWLLSGREFEQALERVVAQPYHHRVEEHIERDPRAGMRPTRQAMRQIATAVRRFPVGAHSPIHRQLRELGFDHPSLPVSVTQRSTVETTDTPENRFVKHALTDFQHYLRVSIDALQRDTSPRHYLIAEVKSLEKEVARWLGSALFRSLPPPTFLPLSSPVLQRRGGYREVLRTWLTFQLATKLAWVGADDILLAGRRDVATLYEYWVFFKLLEVGRELFHLEPDTSALIESTSDKFDLKLRSGRHLKLDGIYTGGSRVISVEFNYNKTFGHSAAYPTPGSWTKLMRPDFTFSFWPAEFAKDEAEAQELMVHVHFDAKYRVDDLLGLFGSDSPEVVDAEKEDLRRGAAPKRADLLKMHAYRDAIRRTEGAYVLYPGVRSSESQEWFEFHEVIPGLGAFALRPQAEASSLQTLRDFLRSISDHVCDTTTRREQQSYHVFRIQEPSGRYRSDPRVGGPEGDRLRPPPPAES